MTHRTDAERDPLAAFCRPDYDGRNILNLLSSIIRAAGGESPHPELHALPADALRTSRQIIYLVIDGLGENQLRDYLADHPASPFFGRHKRDVITTVFPATTASAVTTFATGSSPAEHGILSWHLNLHDLGTVATILISQTRTGLPLIPEDACWRSYLNAPDHLATVPRKRSQLSYAHIPHSPFNRAIGHWTHDATYRTLPGMRRKLNATLRDTFPTLTYAYWPGYDTLCHREGTTHPQSKKHLEKIDATLARIAASIIRKQATLCVTADHGLVDTPPERCVDLRDIPELYTCLATLPAGDVRQVSCLVRPSEEARFLNIVHEQLSGVCACLPGSFLLQQGIYGPGQPQHPALSNRVGDYVLLARAGCGLTASPATQPGKAHFSTGNHGGMSEQEMLVPLYVISPRS